MLYETEELYYSMHCLVYDFSSRMDLASLLDPLGPVRRDAITALTIVTSSGSEALTAMQQLHLLPGLRELELRREMSVRYLNITNWSLLKHQMQAGLAKLESLREVKVFTPEASSALTPAEEQRLEKLRGIDALLERSVSSMDGAGMGTD